MLCGQFRTLPSIAAYISLSMLTQRPTPFLDLLKKLMPPRTSRNRTPGLTDQRKDQRKHRNEPCVEWHGSRSEFVKLSLPCQEAQRKIEHGFQPSFEKQRDFTLLGSIDPPRAGPSFTCLVHFFLPMFANECGPES